MTQAVLIGTTQPEIRAERFLLRPLRISDAGLIQHYTSDRRVAEGTGGSGPRRQGPRAPTRSQCRRLRPAPER